MVIQGLLGESLEEISIRGHISKGSRRLLGSLRRYEEVLKNCISEGLRRKGLRVYKGCEEESSSASGSIRRDLERRILRGTEENIREKQWETFWNPEEAIFGTFCVGYWERFGIHKKGFGRGSWNVEEEFSVDSGNLWRIFLA